MNIWIPISTFAFGIIGGMAFQQYLSIPLIGDDYEIIKPKVKGTNNELKVDQTNMVKRIFNRKKRKEKK
jgi:hypothetical protein